MNKRVLPKNLENCRRDSKHDTNIYNDYFKASNTVIINIRLGSIKLTSNLSDDLIDDAIIN
jgi:hypothetical protein